MLLAIELALVSFLLLIYCLQKPWRHSLLGDRFPGPCPIPIIGNSLDIGTTTADLYVYVLNMYKKFYGGAFRLWAFNNLNIFLTKPEDMEVLLTDHNQLAKSSVYDYFHSWMGDSIATSTGTQWKQTRKFLANTFTKRKLEEYVHTFYANGKILVEIMQSRVGGPAFNIQSVVSLNALDNLSETLMGLDINAQRESNSKYIQAIHDQSNIVVERSFKPWLHSDLIFKVTGMKHKEANSLRVLHGTTTKAVDSRWREVAERGRSEVVQSPENSPFVEASDDVSRHSGPGSGKKAVYVDELIQSSLAGANLSPDRIRGEVDVMGFAGHDTISVCVSFTLWNLAWHPDIQDKVVEELEAFWPDPEENLTYTKLHELRYLEMVVKESLRLYPSIPVIGRRVNADFPLKTDELVAPKGSDVLVGIYLVHRDPAIYPDPEKFDPDRFLAENVRARSPYSYIPFSMGPRFCAGWKFAMLQVKCTVAQLIRTYRFLPGSEKPEVKVSLEPIAGMKEGVPVRIELRDPKVQ